jgi:hypothetical protein
MRTWPRGRHDIDLMRLFYALKKGSVSLSAKELHETLFCIVVLRPSHVLFCLIRGP